MKLYDLALHLPTTLKPVLVWGVVEDFVCESSEKCTLGVINLFAGAVLETLLEDDPREYSFPGYLLKT